MHAAHFVSRWVPKPANPKWINELCDGVSARVVHLSYARNGVDPLCRDWNFRRIFEVVEIDLLRLIDLVPEHLKDIRWNNRVALRLPRTTRSGEK